MKKSILVGLVLLLVGGLVFSMGFFGSGFDLGAVNGDLGPFAVRFGHRRGFGGSVDRQYDVSVDGITQIELVESNTGITVTTSPDAHIHLIYQESDDETMEIKTGNGRLAMKRRSRARNGIFLFWLPDPHVTTELQLPEGLAAEVVVKAFNANVTAEGLTLKGRAEFSSSNGSVTAENLRAADLTLKTSNGSLTAARVRCAGAVLTNSNGIIKAENIDCDALEAKTSNGKLALSRVSGTTVYAKTSNSTVEVDNVSAVESVELRSSNGAIRGTLAGSGDDYRIASKTSNGSNNLPNNWGKGSILLTVETSNGSIDIRFAEE